MTIDPENIKAILATQFNDFGKGQEFHDGWEMVLPQSLFPSHHPNRISPLNYLINCPRINLFGPFSDDL